MEFLINLLYSIAAELYLGSSGGTGSGSSSAGDKPTV